MYSESFHVRIQLGGQVGTYFKIFHRDLFVNAQYD